MRKLVLVSALHVTLILHPVLARSQQLAIQNESGKQTVLSSTDVAALPHFKINTNAFGTETAFEGVALKSVLEKAGVEFGDKMRGKRLASYLLVEAADGYRVVIALPEIDPAFNDKQFLLAFMKDGKPLDSKEGPYRIVIPDEKRMARWVRQVTMLRIVPAQ